MRVWGEGREAASEREKIGPRTQRETTMWEIWVHKGYEEIIRRKHGAHEGAMGVEEELDLTLLKKERER